MEAKRAVGAVLLIASLGGCEESIRYLSWTAPTQKAQLVQDIRTTISQNQQPSKEEVAEAEKRRLSNICDDRPCSTEEWKAADATVRRNDLIERKIFDATKKRNMILERVNTLSGPVWDYLQH